MTMAVGGDGDGQETDPALLDLVGRLSALDDDSDADDELFDEIVEFTKSKVYYSSGVLLRF